MKGEIVVLGIFATGWIEPMPYVPFAPAIIMTPPVSDCRVY